MIWQDCCRLGNVRGSAPEQRKRKATTAKPRMAESVFVEGANVNLRNLGLSGVAPAGGAILRGNNNIEIILDGFYSDFRSHGFQRKCRTLALLVTQEPTVAVESLGKAAHWIEEPRTSLLDGRPERDRPRPRCRIVNSESVPTLGWV